MTNGEFRRKTAGKEAEEEKEESEAEDTTKMHLFVIYNICLLCCVKKE